nr:Acid sphingomyelinase phosphodiesterase 3b [Haemonchus contortus]
MGIKDDRILLLFALLAGATALKILHLADFHLDVDYSVTGDNQHMCHNTTNITKSRLGPFGDYMCDAPKPLVIHAIDEAKRIVTDPDLIIWTGDNVPHVDGYDWNCE